VPVNDDMRCSAERGLAEFCDESLHGPDHLCRGAVGVDDADAVVHLGRVAERARDRDVLLCEEADVDSVLDRAVQKVVDSRGGHVSRAFLEANVIVSPPQSCIIKICLAAGTCKATYPRAMVGISLAWSSTS
jgi:hypothetical protein